MKTIRFSGFICIALAMFALPATAQTPDGMTPAEEGMCDVLNDATPGLKGLCVAMCEAQDCEAELNPFTGEVDFNPSCNPSSDQLLANYNRKAGPSDPRMPCVKIACPCWTEAELENIAGTSTESCIGDPAGTFAGLFGPSTDDGSWEMAYTLNHELNGAQCIAQQSNHSERWEAINAEEYSVCYESVIKQFELRGLNRCLPSAQ